MCNIEDLLIYRSEFDLKESRVFFEEMKIMLIKYYFYSVLALLVSIYIWEYVGLIVHPFADSAGTKERPPRYWGPFSKGHFYMWPIRCTTAPLWIFLMIFLRIHGLDIPDIVDGIGFLILMIPVPMYFQEKIDNK